MEASSNRLTPIYRTYRKVTIKLSYSNQINYPIPVGYIGKWFHSRSLSLSILYGTGLFWSLDRLWWHHTQWEREREGIDGVRFVRVKNRTLAFGEGLLNALI